MSSLPLVDEYPTYACGHQSRRRSARIAQVAPFTTCPACRDAQGAFVLDRLPVLTGSDKQVAWAEQIRREHALAVNQNYSPALAEVIATQTEAAWWIEHRNATMLFFDTFVLSLPAPK